MFPVVEIVLPQPPVANNVPAFLAKLWKMVNNPDAGLFSFACHRTAKQFLLFQTR